MIVKSPIVGALYRGRNIGVDSQELVNFYVESPPSSNAKASLVLTGTPGLKIFTTAGTGGVRGMFVSARQRLFAVVGSDFREIYLDKTSTSRGTLLTNAGRVEFSEIQMTAVGIGGSQIMLVDGIYGYIFRTDTNIFTKITNNYLAGTSVVSINGRFLQNVNDTGSVIYSAQYDGLTWDSGFDYFVCEGSPDPVRSLRTINNEVWCLGSTSTEIWDPTSDADEPFSKSVSGHINIGLSSNYAVTTLGNSVIWCGANNQGQGSIWIGSGYLPQQVSNSSIEYIINNIGDISDCIAYSYAQEGHSFAIFNFISGKKTLCYDLTTQMWHERASFNTLTGKNGYHRAICAVLWDNRIMTGDYDNNYICELDLLTYTDLGYTIKRVRTGPHLHSDMKDVTYNSLEIECERGIAPLQTTDSTSYNYQADPQIMLQWSSNGGRTWSNEHWASLGKRGEYSARARWTRLGQDRDRVFRAEFSAPVKWVVIDSVMDVESE